MATLFFSYSHKDQALRDELETHLAMLKREGTIESWHDRAILAGDEVDVAIDEKLRSADVILLLVSPDFLASRYCYDVEVKLAMQRHEARDTRVIPVILRSCDWKSAPFAKILVTPTDGKPITKWADRDEAFLDVITQIRAAVPATKKSTSSNSVSTLQPTRSSALRSSNLRLKKEFSEADNDRFLDESFNFIALFFENSLSELAARHSGIEGRFKRIDAETFSSVVYRSGKALARCTIHNSGSRSGITYSREEGSRGNSYNESLSVEASDQSLYLKPMGMAITVFAAFERDRHLTMEGAAEYYWAMLIEPLQ